MLEDDLLSLGNRVRKIRKDRGFSQDKLSNLSHISPRHLAKIEKGQINPSFEILSALVNALSITYDALLLDPTTEQEDADIKELIGIYRACPEDKRHWIMSAAHFVVNELNNEDTSDK